MNGSAEKRGVDTRTFIKAGRVGAVVQRVPEIVALWDRDWTTRTLGKASRAAREGSGGREQAGEVVGCRSSPKTRKCCGGEGAPVDRTMKKSRKPPRLEAEPIITGLARGHAKSCEARSSDKSKARAFPEVLDGACTL